MKIIWNTRDALNLCHGLAGCPRLSSSKTIENLVKIWALGMEFWHQTCEAPMWDLNCPSTCSQTVDCFIVVQQWQLHQHPCTFVIAIFQTFYMSNRLVRSCAIPACCTHATEVGMVHTGSQVQSPNSLEVNPCNLNCWEYVPLYNDGNILSIGDDLSGGLIKNQP